MGLLFINMHPSIAVVFIAISSSVLCPTPIGFPGDDGSTEKTPDSIDTGVDGKQVPGKCFLVVFLLLRKAH